MAEITKITTPMMPKENTSIKHKPVTDQAFDLTDPSKVHKSDNEGQIKERQSNASTLLKDTMGRQAVVPLLKNPSEMMQTFKKIAFLVEMGVSASDAAKDEATKELLESLFVSPKQVPGVLAEQDKSSVLFKGEAFDILRDIMDKFGESPKIRDMVVNLLKTFERNVNAQNSTKTILYNCNNLLGYMFSRDRSQFSSYIRDLAQMLLPRGEAAAFIDKMADIPIPQQPQTQGQPQIQNQPQAQGQPQIQDQPQIQNQPQVQGQPQIQDQLQAQGQPQIQGQPQTQGQPLATGQEAVMRENLPADAQNMQATQDIPAQQSPEIQAQKDFMINEAAGQTQSARGTEGTNQARDTQVQQDAQGQHNTQGQQTGDQVYDPVNNVINTQKFGRELYQTGRQGGEAGSAPQLSQREVAHILKNNLLPLLSEVVVKYNQSDKIRDTVMAVVHNIVRVDKGTPENLREAVNKLMNELNDVATVPKAFEKQFLEAINQSVKDAKSSTDSIVSKMSDVVSEALRSPDTNPAVLRQAENMLISMLQNQSSMMDILHFVIPFQTPQGQVFTELYVDPETEEKVGRQKGQSRKIFISVESEAHGSFELSFLETGERVDFTMWAPEDLVQSLSGLKRNFANIMQLHGYTMNTFKVDEMKAPHTVAEVFPRLIEKKVGIDVNV